MPLRMLNSKSFNLNLIHHIIYCFWAELYLFLISVLKFLTGEKLNADQKYNIAARELNESKFGVF